MKRTKSPSPRSAPALNEAFLPALLNLGLAIQRDSQQFNRRLPPAADPCPASVMQEVLSLLAATGDAAVVITHVDGRPDMLEIMALALVCHFGLLTDTDPNVRLVSELVGREQPHAILKARQAIRRLCDRSVLMLQPGNGKMWNGNLCLSGRTHDFLGLLKPDSPLFMPWKLRKEPGRVEPSGDCGPIPPVALLRSSIRERVKGAYLEGPIRAIAGMYAMQMHRARLIRAGRHPGTPNVIGLFVGSSSVGKTFLAETAARCLNAICGPGAAPFSSFSATDLTAEGYVGCSVEDVVRPLLEQAGGDAERARFGCCLIDEFDKKAARATHGVADVGGRCVQENLLRILGGSVFPVGGRRASFEPPSSFNSDGTMFILAGAFTGLQPILEGRNRKAEVIGFGGEGASRSESRLRDALVEYGLIPEIISRIGSIVVFPDPFMEDLKEMSLAPGGLLECYARLWSEMGLSVSLTDAAVTAMAAYGHETRSFARGIQAVLNRMTERLVSEEGRGSACLGEVEIRHVIDSMSVGTFSRAG
jgi:hypothetical protein